MSSVCSIPALTKIIRSTLDVILKKVHSQSFGLPTESLALCTRSCPPALHKTDPYEQDISCLEGNTMFLRAPLQIFHSDTKCHPRVVMQGLLAAIRVIVNHVEENASAANPVLSPVYAQRIRLKQRMDEMQKAYCEYRA